MVGMQVEGLEHDPDIAAAEAGQRVLVERAERLASDRDRAGVGPLEPGHDHQQRRLAGAGRADEADRLAAAYMKIDVVEDMDAGRAPPEREVDAGERDRRRRRDPEVSCMQSSVARCLADSCRGFGIASGRPDVAAERGDMALRVQVFSACGAVAAAVVATLALSAVPPRPSAPIQLMAFGDSLTAGFGLAAGDAFPVRLETALKAKGHDVTVANASVSGDTTAGGLARLDWSVPAITEAVWSSSAPTTCCAASTRSATASAREDPAPAQCRASRCCWSAWGPRRISGADYKRDSTRSIPIWRPSTTCRSIRSSSTAWRRSEAQPAGRLHPLAAGVDRIVAGILPKAEELVARVREKRGS